MMEFPDFITPQEGKVMSIIVIGIDLAKSISACHGVNEAGKAELVKPRVSREQLLPLIAQLAPCLIGWRAHKQGVTSCIMRFIFQPF